MVSSHFKIIITKLQKTSLSVVGKKISVELIISARYNLLQSTITLRTLNLTDIELSEEKGCV